MREWYGSIYLRLREEMAALESMCMGHFVLKTVYQGRFGRIRFIAVRIKMGCNK